MKTNQTNQCTCQMCVPDFDLGSEEVRVRVEDQKREEQALTRSEWLQKIRDQAPVRN